MLHVADDRLDNFLRLNGMLIEQEGTPRETIVEIFKALGCTETLNSHFFDDLLEQHDILEVFLYSRYSLIFVQFPRMDGDTYRSLFDRIAIYSGEHLSRINKLYLECLNSPIYYRYLHLKFEDQMSSMFSMTVEKLCAQLEHLRDYTLMPEFDFFTAKYPYVEMSDAELCKEHQIIIPRDIGAGEFRLRIYAWIHGMEKYLWCRNNIQSTTILNRDLELINGDSVHRAQQPFAWGTKQQCYVLDGSEICDMLLRIRRVVAPDGTEIPLDQVLLYEYILPLTHNGINIREIIVQEVSPLFFTKLLRYVYVLRGSEDGDTSANLLELPIAHHSSQIETMLLEMNDNDQCWDLPVYNWHGPTGNTLRAERNLLFQGGCRLHISHLFISTIYHYQPQLLARYPKSQLYALRIHIPPLADPHDDEPLVNTTTVRLAMLNNVAEIPFDDIPGVLSQEDLEEL